MNPMSDQDKVINHNDLETIFVSIDDSLPMRKIGAMVDRMDVSADAKAFILDVASLTIEIGERVVAVGRKIISFALGLLKRFPNTAFGIVLALILGSLVASAFGGIPLIGAVLVAKLNAIMLLFGIAWGTINDLSQMPIKVEVDEFVGQMAPIAKVVG